MPISVSTLRPLVLRFFLALAAASALSACEDEEAPAPAPAGIEILSGDAQYTRKGTELEEPVVVRVMLEDGHAGDGLEVRFQAIEGGGSLSRTGATTASDGSASVRWTMGPDTGTNRLRVSVADNTSLNVEATATAAEYYCPEEDPAFVQKFTNPHSLMLLTRASSLTQIGGIQVAGLVKIESDFDTEFFPTSFSNYDEGTFLNVIRDCAFSANGDLFLSWNGVRDEIVKVAANGTASHFAFLDSPLGAELAMTPGGVLMGCDERGPFAVTCRDTLFRYEDALYSGDPVTRDATNNDAVAVDPTSGDLYFIYKGDRWLKRLPLDGITQAGAISDVVQLPIDVSDGARGMVVDAADGSVYILVDYTGTTTTKAIVKVTSAGAQTTEFDFFSRGAGDAAGIQNDLAIDRNYSPGERHLYTLDTKNNVVLMYRLNTQELVVLTSGTDPDGASDESSGERVGLDVIPGP